MDCWGTNHAGQAGGIIGTDQRVPMSISGLQFSSVVTGSVSDFTCGISVQGRAYCWGTGQLGQLGNGGFTSSAQPLLVKLVH